MVKAALWYARHGWRVFPIWPIRDGQCGCGNIECRSQGKHPIEYLTGDWRKSATTHQETISRWWLQVPDANLATCDHLRIDVDTKDNGRENWEDLVVENGRPNTWQCLTPSGGEHWYFRAPSDWQHSNETGQLPRGIDVRGHGTGYTLLPPSNHLQGTYEWEVSSRPDGIPVASLPEWLSEMLKPTSGGRVEVSFRNDADKPDLDSLPISELIRAAIMSEPDSSRDRSRIDQSVITSLCRAGASDDQIKSVFDHYPIGTAGKYSEIGRNAEKYLAYSISSARAYIASKQPKTEPIKELEEVQPPLTDSQREQVQQVIARIDKEGYWRGYHDAMTQAHRDWWYQHGFTDGIIDRYGLGYASKQVDQDTGEILSESAFTVPIVGKGGQVVNIEYRLDDGQITYEVEAPNIHYVEPTDKPLLLWPDAVSALQSYLQIGSLPYTFAGLPQFPLDNDMIGDTAVVILDPDTETAGRRLRRLNAKFVRLPVPAREMISKQGAMETPL